MGPRLFQGNRVVGEILFHLGMMVVNNPLRRPYFLGGGGIEGGALGP